MARTRDYKVTVETGRGNRAESTIHAENEGQASDLHSGSGNLRVVSVEPQPGTERDSV
jgi:hypothetical protein